LADAVVQAVHGPRSHHTTGPLTDRREDDIAVLLLCRAGDGCGCGADRDLVRPPVRRTMLTVAQTEPEQVSVARQQLRELLHDWSSPDQLDSAVLLLSEVLTNVLVHTDADALMVAEVTGGGEGRRVRIEVTDTVDDLPHLRSPGELASSGRGLLLIELLADGWGVDPRGRGKTIWFELYETGDPSGAGGTTGTNGAARPTRPRSDDTGRLCTGHRPPRPPCGSHGAPRARAPSGGDGARAQGGGRGLQPALAHPVDRRDGAEAALLEVLEGLLELLAGVHDERAVVGHGLADRAAAEED